MATVAEQSLSWEDQPSHGSFPTDEMWPLMCGYQEILPWLQPATLPDKVKHPFNVLYDQWGGIKKTWNSK